MSANFRGNLEVMGLAASSLPKNLNVQIATSTDDLLKEIGARSFGGGDDTVLMGTCYVQGGRLFFTTAMVLPTYLAIANSSVSEVADDIDQVEKKMNRPINGPHRSKARDYLRKTAVDGEGGPFILPPLILNYGTQDDHVDTGDGDDFRPVPPSTLIVCGGSALTAAAVFVIPAGVQLPITDGAHRTSALKLLVKDLSSKTKGSAVGLERLRHNAVSVVVGFEAEIGQAHQDFADCAATRPMSKSIRNAYDVRDQASSMAVDLVKAVPLLKRFTDATAQSYNVTDKSKHVYTLAALRNHTARIVELDVDHSAPSASKNDLQALIEFWVKMTETHVPAFSYVRENGVAADARAVRGGSIWLKPAGLALLARIYWSGYYRGIPMEELAQRVGAIDGHLLMQGKTMADWTEAAERTDADGLKAGYDSTVDKFVNPLWKPFWKLTRDRNSVSSNADSVASVWDSTVKKLMGFEGPCVPKKAA